MKKEETKVLNAIREAIATVPGVTVHRQHSGKFVTKYGSVITVGRKGDPDTTGNSRGIFFAMEAKKDEDLSPEQIEYLEKTNRWAFMGGCGCVIRDVPTAIMLITAMNNQLNASWFVNRNDYEVNKDALRYELTDLGLWNKDIELGWEQFEEKEKAKK